jgi:putative ABC transport system permease protein
MMDLMLLDLRTAFRSLRRSRTFTLTVIACLALGVGANTAVFSVVSTVLLRPLPFPEPDRLVNLWVGYEGPQSTIRYFLSPQQFIEIRERNSVLAEMAASRVEQSSLEQDGQPVEATTAITTASLFELIGAEPLIGRTFSNQEDGHAAAVAVISEGLWGRAFGRDGNVVGRSLRLNGSAYEIVGVLPDEARVPQDVEVWLPLSIDRIEGRARESGGLTAIARLNDEVTLDAARKQLAVLADDIARDLPERNTNLSIGIAQWHEFLVENVRTALLVLWVAVAGLLAVAVSNVVSLLIVRAQRERRHQALRAALGAGWSRILQYLVIENGLAVGAGGVLGVLTARLSLPALLALQPNQLSPFRQVTIDSMVLGFSLALVIAVTAIVTGLTVWRLRYGSLTRRLAEGGSGGGVSRNTLAAQRLLVVAQIAASLVLLVGSSLMIRSFSGLLRADPGFVSGPVLAIRVAAPPARSSTHDLRVGYFREVLNAVRSGAGVEAAGAAHVLPVTDVRWGIGFNVEGQPPETRAHRHAAVWRVVTPGYYEAMQIPMLRGRTFTEYDRSDTEPVVVISKSLAQTYWPGEDPLGKRVKRGTYEDPSEPWRTVVGVMADVRDSALAARPAASLHFPHSQYTTPVTSRMQIVVRMAGDIRPEDQAAALENAVRAVDPSALIHEVAPYRRLLGETAAQERFNALLLSIFAAAGLVLAAVGLYGVVSYSAGQRKREFGIRVAFGAVGRDVRRLMLKAGAFMAITGASLGLALSYGLAPIVESLLPSGGARDPLPYIIAAATLLITTVIAAWIPAQRAGRVDPVIVLRD